MIEIKNITKSFNGYIAVDNVSINVKKGTIHGIIGENGAGKTTVIKCLTGIYKPDKGKILIDANEVYENPTVKEKIGYVSDGGSFFNDYNLLSMIKFYSGIYKTFSKEKFDELNNVFNIDTKKKIGRMSKGQKMRISFMLNLSILPEVFVLDEPTSGLDPIAKRQLLNMLTDEVEKRQMTVFISSHHLSELERLCDEISIINNGRITYQSSIDSIKQQVRRFQVLFKNNPDLSSVKDKIEIEKIGSIYYITTDSFDKGLEDTLYSLGAEFIEEIGMNLEEIFIYTHQRRNKI